jgi:hypothetical protein
MPATSMPLNRSQAIAGRRYGRLLPACLRKGSYGPPRSCPESWTPGRGIFIEVEAAPFSLRWNSAAVSALLAAWESLGSPSNILTFA